MRRPRAPFVTARGPRAVAGLLAALAASTTAGLGASPAADARAPTDAKAAPKPVEPTPTTKPAGGSFDAKAAPKPVEPTQTTKPGAGSFDAKRAPKPVEPTQTIKPASGYFDETFALEPGGARAFVVRTDDATFAKLESIELATGKTTSSFDLPPGAGPLERLEPLEGGKGVVLVTREGSVDLPKVVATLIDAAGKVVAKTPPADGLGRPLEAPRDVLVAYDVRSGPREGEVTYTITPRKLDTLAPAGKPRVYKTTAAGELKTPPFRLFDFNDGYARAVGERPRAYDKQTDVRQPAKMALLDTLSGKIVKEAEIGDVMAWLQASKQRAHHPGRVVFADLNQGDSGVDVVDAMGKRTPVELAVPFGLYDPKSLTDQEGPEPGAFLLGIAVDPLNADAVKRQKPDLPMLDLYGASKPDAPPTLRARIFIPRNVTWRAGYGKVVVLKRFKSFTRGGDELAVYPLR
jgi:hypothetical protein